MDRVGPTIVGRRSTPGADAARDLLTRNDVPHRWVDLDRDPLAPLLETASLSAARLPLVLFPDSTQLEGPEDYTDLVSGRTERVTRERYLASAHWRAELAARAGLRTTPSNDLQVIGITLTSGSRLRGRSGVIATGVAYRQLNAPGVERFVGQGVHYESATDAAPTYAGGHVIMVGGANSAGQAALHLAKHAKHVTMLVRGESLARAMSRYLVDRIEAEERITVRTSTRVSRAEGGDWLERVVVAGPGGEESIDANGMFVLIGGEPLTAGVEDWLRCDANGYLMTGSELHAEADRSWWPLAREPLFLESSQPGLFVAGDVRHGSIKRVASAVGEGATSIALVHSYLAALAL